MRRGPLRNRPSVYVLSVRLNPRFRKKEWGDLFGWTSNPPTGKQARVRPCRRLRGGEVESGRGTVTGRQVFRSSRLSSVNLFPPWPVFPSCLRPPLKFVPTLPFVGSTRRLVCCCQTPSLTSSLRSGPVPMPFVPPSQSSLLNPPSSTLEPVKEGPGGPGRFVRSRPLRFEVRHRGFLEVLHRGTVERKEQNKRSSTRVGGGPHTSISSTGTRLQTSQGGTGVRGEWAQRHA